MSIEVNGNSWRIKSGDLSLAWALSETNDLLLTSLHTLGKEWVVAPIPALGLANSKGSTIHFRDPDVTIEEDTICFSGHIEPGDLTVDLAWTADEDASVITSTINVRNQTNASVELGSLTSLRAPLALDDRSSHLSVLNGGRWDETMPPRGYRLQTFDMDHVNRHWFGAADDGRSTGEFLPWFALHNPQGGLLSSLVWSGRWRLDLFRVNQTIELGFGISEFTHVLAPNESIELPGLVMAGFAGDLDDATNRWRHWITNNWTPATPENWPWVQYNHWYAYAGDIDEERLFSEAEYAAAAGAEVFVIDDGWFRGRLPESYIRGWGDWVQDDAKFPNGIKTFSDRIHALGMKFGIWVEPERADDEGELARNHTEFIATIDGEPVCRFTSGNQPGVHLCLGNPDVVEWMSADLTRVVQDYGVDWLKWDYNCGYGLGCNASDHGHQAGDGHYAHTHGLYAVLSALRTACPDLVIENCASGGHRTDLGTLRHTHTNWVSDYTYRAASCRQHVQGAGLFLPLAHLNTWVVDYRDTYEFRSRMGGAFGFSSHMGRWSEAERENLRLAINEYKELRPFLSGERYLLTGPWHQEWEVWEFVHPDGKQVALLVFREGSTIERVTVRPRLEGLSDNLTVKFADVPTSENRDAVSLRTKGIPLALGNRESAIVWIS